MWSFFSPAITLTNRLGYTKKFALPGLISLIAVAVVGYSLFTSLNQVIRKSQYELKGIALIKPISLATQFIQQHRGFSAGFLGGDEAMRGRRATKESEATEALHSVEEKLPPNLITSEAWRHIKIDWERLRKEGLNLAVAENFAAHTRLINQILIFEASAADEYALTLDPDLGTSYLIETADNKLPVALEELGEIRAYGIAFLAKKQASEQDKMNIHTLVAELSDALNTLRINLDKTGRYNPAMQSSLSAVSHEISDSAQVIVDIVQTDILTGRFTLAPEDFFRVTTEAIDRGYAQMYGSLLPAAEALIKARINHAENELRASIGIAVLILMVVAYFVIGIYYAIIGSIQSLARSARAFAGGNMHERINLGTRDELNQVGDSFNEMADGFISMMTARHEGEALLRATIDTALDAVVQMDAEGIIVGWNNQAANTFGWSNEEVVGRMLHETIIPPQYREAHINGLKRFLASGEETVLNSRIEVMGLHRHGHEFPIELAITSVKMAGKHEFTGFIRDITRKKESEELIWKQANFDKLTGLPNRHMFHDRLEQEIKKAHRSGQQLALLFIDLDLFKEINDTLGHNMGDILLGTVARRIGECVRETDTVARLGGDEFTVILPELSDAISAERIVRNILQRLAEPYLLGEDVAHISASIGITLYPNDATEMEGMLKNADQAMYAAKNEGRNCYSYFTPMLKEAAQARLQLANDLRGALAGKQFMVYFQPIVDMATGSINKAEALIRWRHPERGLVSPVEFIPLAEETGLILEIGDWVFKESVRWVKRWRTLYNPEFQVSVNKSPAQFHKDGDDHKAWLAHLQGLGLPGQSIVIEITEGLLLDADAITGALLTFRDAGIQVAIDDFGTGYSSLSYLKKFDIDYLKIDQSFTRNLTPDSSDLALSEAIIVMAHKLGLKVIAEGVETEAQRGLLAAAGCDYVQGYLYSRPVSPEEFEALLKNSLSRL